MNSLNSPSTNPQPSLDPYRTAAAWANPSARPVIHPDDETLLIPVGVPTVAEDDSFWLNATVGPNPLIADQGLVLGALIKNGAWASVKTVPLQYHEEIGGMVDAGLIYAFNFEETSFYRNDLIPKLLFDRNTPLEFGQVPEGLFEMIDIGVPRGVNSAARFPTAIFRVLDSIDNKRTANHVVDFVMDSIFGELGVRVEDLPKGEQAEALELKKFVGLSLVLAVQSGLVAFDIE